MTYRITLVFCLALVLAAMPAFCDEPPALSEPGPETANEDRIGEIDQRVDELSRELTKLRKEAEARKKLEITAEEESREGEEILSAAGREYTLLPKGEMGVEYSFSYTYTSTDVFEDNIEHVANHNLENALFFEYALKDNLTLNANIPFVYTYDKTGTSSSKTVTDFGDISFGCQYQPLKAGGKWPVPIINTTLTIPTSRGSYEVDPDNDLSTGLGAYALSVGISMSKKMDPLMAFGTLSYKYRHNITDIRYKGHLSTGEKDINSIYADEVKPGDIISLSMGVGYSLSYNVSLSLSYQLSHRFGTDLYNVGKDDQSFGSTTSSSFNLGTGWIITPQHKINVNLYFGLTNSDQDFTLLVRAPFNI